MNLWPTSRPFSTLEKTICQQHMPYSAATYDFHELLIIIQLQTMSWRPAKAWIIICGICHTISGLIKHSNCKRTWNWKLIIMTIKSPTVILQRGILSIFHNCYWRHCYYSGKSGQHGTACLPAGLQPSSVLVSGIGIDDLLLAWVQIAILIVRLWTYSDKMTFNRGLLMP